MLIGFLCQAIQSEVNQSLALQRMASSLAFLEGWKVLFSLAMLAVKRWHASKTVGHDNLHLEFVSSKLVSMHT